ncbi:uncharacterized protein LOC129600990 [Paramacrobiotus metropolitanus]|uniref:uncharacterized protein LOC129600990 n=1 Tax=Paramacrobiotus metropolitanus TaxID=2943436 RepID=UPI00244650E2|nr:uncharacterized protein LOC129600990 [Paramacrobiotus metropolitanus]
MEWPYWKLRLKNHLSLIKVPTDYHVAFLLDALSPEPFEVLAKMCKPQEPQVPQTRIDVLPRTNVPSDTRYPGKIIGYVADEYAEELAKAVAICGSLHVDGTKTSREVFGERGHVPTSCHTPNRETKDTPVGKGYDCLDIAVSLLFILPIFLQIFHR